TSPHPRYALEAINQEGFLALRQDETTPPQAEDFLCEYANPAAEALLKGAVTGKPLFITHPELALAGIAWGQVMASGQAHTCVLELKRGAMARQVRARAVRVETGLMAVWLSDVTENERFVRETADFEERMLAFVECMPDPFFAMDEQGRLFYVNGAGERLLGKRRQALMGRPLFQEYTEGPGSRLRTQVRHVMSTSLPVEFEEHFNTRTFQATVVPLGQGVLVYLHDVTMHQAASTVARGSTALFQALLQGSTDAIYTKDLQGRYTRINEAGARLMGRAAESVLGHTDAELWPEGTARVTLAHDREVLAFRQTLTYEDVETQPEPRVWQSTKGVLRDETGSVAGLFGISRDVTDLKRTRDALSAASMTLWELRLPEQRLYWERGAAEHFALESLPAEESLDTFLARIHIEDRPLVTRALSLETLSTQEVSLVYRLWLGNGTQRRHALRARLSPLNDGWRVLGVLEDVTEPRREVRPLRERGHG
ncbi:MAG: PAS domain-containing protein, partial [Cystobacter sp.]